MLLLAGGGLMYCVGGHFYFRIDLTEDQRYRIHPATQKLLRELKEEMRVAIYLAGDLPTGFKQLKRATQELLEECNIYAHHQLHYEFIDLDKVPAEEKKDCLRKLAARGIQPTNLYMQEKGQRIERLIFPAALLTYKDKEEGVLLLKGNKMATPAQMINQSMEGLEYELANAIERLVCTRRKQVALLRGHGAPDLKQLSGLINALEAHYGLQLIDFSDKSALEAYDAVLITKPQQPFSEKEKYVLDQYIMKGGKVLFFLDKLRVNMEHLRKHETFAFPLEVGLDDQLFRYGVRINADLVQDLCSGVYPVVVGNLGNKPQLKLLPWPFFPLLNHFSDHLVTKNLDVLYPQFSSSIDMIQTQGVVHTPLVFTSQYSGKLGAPVHLALEALRQPPEPANYNHSYIPVAYLLEGTFTSLYKNRFLPEGFDTAAFFPESQLTKLLVVASGSMVLNGVDLRKQKPLPWGYDPFLQQHFANQDFVCNVLAYMLNEEGLIKLKNKSLKIRLLDQVKLAQERRWWQLMNLIVPILLLGLLGVLWNYLYKSIYTKF
jgi:gliding-associated putative ABC transporter substrate-binding component GldG